MYIVRSYTNARGDEMFEAIGQRIRGAVLTTGVMMACMLPTHAQQAETASPSAGTVTVSSQTMERLQQHLAELEGEVKELKAEMHEMRLMTPSATIIPGSGLSHVAADDAAQETPLPSEVHKAQGNALLSADDRSILDY